MCLRSWPYVEGSSGWGESTTKQEQFCEMHYYMTPYIAEFINTISNLAYILFGAYGIRKLEQLHHDGSIFWSYVSLATVGLGSTAFHSTVKYTGQIADEISMLYATATIAYAVFSIDYNPKQRQLLVAFLTLVVTAITTVHVYRGESTVFQVCWASMVISIFAKCTRLLKSCIHAEDVHRQMGRLTTWGSDLELTLVTKVSFLTGFLLWNIDNIMCSSLLQFRSIIGIPWGFVTELHGWWHILTGLGVYHYIVFIHYLRVYIVNSRSDTRIGVELAWPRYSVLPYLRGVDVDKKAK